MRSVATGPRASLMQPDDLIAALARLVPSDRLLTAPGALAAYESDGLTSFRARPRPSCSPSPPTRSSRPCAPVTRRGVPFMARGSGTSLSGGAVPIEDGIVIALNRHEPRPAVRSRRARRRRRTWRREPGGDGARGAARPLLRARSVEPVGMHDRRQRRVQLRRRALLPPRHDGQPRARDARRARRRHASRRSGGDSLEQAAPISAACSSAPKACSASRSRSRCASWRARRSTAPCSRPTTRLQAAGDAVSRIIESGLLPGAMEIMDRLAMDAAEAAVQAGYPTGAAAVLIVELEGEDAAGGRGVRRG